MGSMGEILGRCCDNVSIIAFSMSLGIRFSKYWSLLFETLSSVQLWSRIASPRLIFGEPRIVRGDSSRATSIVQERIIEHGVMKA